MDFDIKKFIKKMKLFTSNTYCSRASSIDNIFYTNKKNDYDWKYGILTINGKKIFDELHKNYDLPKEIIYLYYGLETENDEIIYNNFTFISLNNIKKQVDEQNKYGQNKFIDLGITYAGMGHCFILSWHKIENKFFFRLDGGSNYYDVEYHYDMYIKKPIDFNNKRNILFSWDEIVKIIDDKTISMNCLRL